MTITPRVDDTMTPEAFIERFDGMFTRTAFRVELLELYEGKGFRAWQAGEQVTSRPWEADVRKWRASEREITRVHVLPKTLTEYLHFEFECYAGSVAAGEGVWLLLDAAVRGMRLELPPWDFWLFDEELVVVMFYDDAGNWTGVELVTDAGLVAQCCRWRDALMEHAVSFSEYMTEGVPV
jgi:hypothetical protein